MNAPRESRGEPRRSPGADEERDLVEEVVPLEGRDLRLLRPRDSEALLDDEAFEHEEFLPYWAELWPSSLALARRIARRALRGARTLELGCGLGLPSIAAALAGGRVLATDWSAEAVELTATNAERNGAALETLVCSWTAPEPLLAHAPWDLVLASDVLYERRNADLLLELLPRLTADVWLADPGRPPAARFLEAAAGTWRITSARAPELANGAVYRLRQPVAT
jgi:predicted nicotinamide N-methyase